MIAAAAAAMIGAAEAVTQPLNFGVYDVSASLKTTTGKQGKVVKHNPKSYTLNLGTKTLDKDDFWWKDDALKPFVQAYLGKDKFASAEEAKAWVKALKTDAEKKALADALLFNYAQYDADGAAVAKKTGDYTAYTKQVKINEKGKRGWCATMTFKVTPPDDPAKCYRVATSRTWKGLVTGDCCGDPINGLQWDLFDADGNYIASIDNRLLYRFGAQDLAKSTKIEYFGSINSLNNDQTSGNDPVGAAVVNKPHLAFAGQGTWSANLGKDDNFTYEGISAINGNIVGWLPPPDCFACCDNAELAIAFFCDAVTDADEIWRDIANQKGKRGTAAFGTWSMKFNKKLSNLK